MQGFLCVWNRGMWGRRTPLHSTFVDHRTQTVFTLMSSIFSFTIFVNSLKIRAKIPASQTSDPKHPKIRKRWVKGQRGNSWPWTYGSHARSNSTFLHQVCLSGLGEQQHETINSWGGFVKLDWWADTGVHVLTGTEAAAHRFFHQIAVNQGLTEKLAFDKERVCDVGNTPQVPCSDLCSAFWVQVAVFLFTLVGGATYMGFSF